MQALHPSLTAQALGIRWLRNLPLPILYWFAVVRSVVVDGP